MFASAKRRCWKRDRDSEAVVRSLISCEELSIYVIGIHENDPAKFYTGDIGLPLVDYAPL